MKKIINATIFQCEYCNKISYSAGGMRLHEISCKRNPINHTPCASCANLCKSSVLISDQDYEPEEIHKGDIIEKDFIKDYFNGILSHVGDCSGDEYKYHRETNLICKIDGSKLYHNRVNRLSKEKSLLIKNRCDKQMPNECENYKNNLL